ncbi:MAG: glycoside hydrolase domain-containing protein [Bifidobacterium sp.]|uniref:Uncharacterized protein n=4 Tax=Bifidobacterium TaxID=1678 RepID=A0A261GBL6_9BIFI|nr:hypothetical protein BAQU_0095 [Bifidobacterium aquikefiri]
MADAMVLATQQWLNATYGSVDGWVSLAEDGNTGWNTIYGLRRGLQHELGISPVSSGFGTATTAAFTAKIGKIDASTTSQNVLRLVSGSLWCKGYSGWNFTDPMAFTNLVPSVSRVRSDLGLDATIQSIDVKLMASLMSMDAYVIPETGSGTGSIRTVQQWLNGMYSTRGSFALVPCDGLYSRQIQTAMLYGLQYEFGMDDATANGNFGPGTRQGLRDSAPVSQGDADSSHHYVRLFQGALRLNGYADTPFDGSFGAQTGAQASSFQSFMELTVTGEGDYGTWCALLVSTGDPDRTTKGFDTSTQLTGSQAQGAADAGYTHVGRYTVGSGKNITIAELGAIKAAGLRLFPIHERYNNSDSVMTAAEGETQGAEATARCRLLGLPMGSTVFFAVDYDPNEDSIAGPVSDFFNGIADGMKPYLNGAYAIGVYGTRNVCQSLTGKGLASAVFVAGMSTGWSGNMGFPMPPAWQYNQIQETTASLGGSSIGIDKDAISSRAAAIDLASLTLPPTEKDGDTPAQFGLDVLYDWIVSAEIKGEKAIYAANSLLNPMNAYAGFMPDYILGWLRKPTYWSDGEEKSIMWHTYTPEPATNEQEVLARAAVEEALGTAGTTGSLPSVNTSYRDVPHMAATCLGYRDWGVDIAANKSDAGDLGGWLLDLLQLWGSYEGSGENADLSTWAAQRLGVVDADGGFAYADVLADADGWLLQKAMSGDTSGLALGNAMRSIYQADGNQRIRNFYSSRFNANPDNVSAAFTMVLNGIDVWGVNLGFTTKLLLAAAKASGMPSASQADALARVYARFLASPSR